MKKAPMGAFIYNLVIGQPSALCSGKRCYLTREFASDQPIIQRMGWPAAIFGKSQLDCCNNGAELRQSG